MHWPVRLAKGATALLLAASVWFIGPLMFIGDVQPLDSTLARVLTLAVLAGVWWCIRLLMRRLASRIEARQTPPRFDFADVMVALTATSMATALIFIGRAYVSSSSHIARQNEVAVQMRQQARELGPESSLTDILGLLDLALSATQDWPRDMPPLLGIGLDKGQMLAVAAEQAYRSLLNSLLQPQVQRALERQLRDAPANPLFHYELLKSYLALADRQHVDSDVAYVLTEVLVRASAALNVDAKREALRSHVTAMLSETPIPPVTVDTALVASARAELANVPRQYFVLYRALASIDQSSAGWSLGSAGGPNAAAVFELISGSALTDTLVESEFTPDIYRSLPLRIEASVMKLKGKTWVLTGPVFPESEAGKLGDVGLTDDETEKVFQAAFRIYVEGYIKAWDSALAKVQVRRSPPPQGAAAIGPSLMASPLHLMSKPVESPLAVLARSLADATSLSRRPSTGIEKIRSRVNEAVARRSPKQWELSTTRMLDDHFASLHRWVQPDESGHAPIDATLASLRAAHESLLAQAQGSAPAGSAATPSTAVARALADARSLPRPFRDLVLDALGDAQRIVASGLQRSKR